MHHLSIILTSFSLLLLTSCAQISNSSPSTASNVPDGWALYKNSLYSLSYPSEWIVKEEVHGTGGPATGTETIFSNMSADSSVCSSEYISMSFDTSSCYWEPGIFEDSFSDLIESEEWREKNWPDTLYKTRFAGRSAYRAGRFDEEIGCHKTISIVKIRDGQCMIIKTFAGGSPVNERVIDSVLDSFQIKN